MNTFGHFGAHGGVQGSTNAGRYAGRMRMIAPRIVGAWHAHGATMCS